MAFKVNFKHFLLICVVFLSILLLFSIQNFFAHSNEATIPITINSTTTGAKLHISGATLSNLEIIKSSPLITFTDSDIFIKGPGVSDLRIKLSDVEKQIRFTLKKDQNGEVFLDFKGLGTLKNSNNPINIPLRLSTDSSFAKLTFINATIVDTTVKSADGLVNSPIINGNSITLINPSLKEIDLTLDASIDFKNTDALVILEKGDEGIFSANIGKNYFITDNKNQIEVYNLPLLIETTANVTEITISNSKIIKGEFSKIDINTLTNFSIRDNSVLLTYENPKETKKTAEGLLSLQLQADSNLSFTQSNPGFATVKLGTDEYSCNSSVDKSSQAGCQYTLGEMIFNKGIGDNEVKISLPVTIETTSDWTEVTFEGFKNLEIKEIESRGSIRTHVYEKTIFIEKSVPKDTSLAHLTLLLKTSKQKDAQILISKGDLGTTTVKAGDDQEFINNKDISRDPKNTMFFAVSDLSDLTTTSNNQLSIYQNSEKIYLPVFSLFADQGLDVEKNLQSDSTLLISEKNLPVSQTKLPDSVLIGIFAFIIISFTIIGIFSVVSLKKTGFFDFLPTKKLSQEYLIKLFATSFWKLPLSSVIIVEAICCLIIISPLLFIDANAATGTAILAYFFLIGGILIRLLEIKEILPLEKQKEIFIKMNSLAVLLAAGYIGVFEIKNNLVLSGIAFGILILCTLAFLWCVNNYINNKEYYDSC